MIFYGGEYPEASLISSQAKTAGLKIPLMGGDGIYDKTYISVAGAAGEGDLATSVGAPAESLDTAKQFVTDYNAAKYADAFSAYGALSYDAANIIINAIAKVIGGKSVTLNDQVRQDIIKAVQATDLQGATGSLKFDSYGDTLSKVLTVYKVENGAWKSVKVGEFGK